MWRRRTTSPDEFRNMASQFLASPTPDKRTQLVQASHRLSPEAAKELLQEVHEAYDGRHFWWLASETALAVLFDVGDLIDHLSDAAASTSDEVRQAESSRAETERREAHEAHRNHVLHIEERRTRQLGERRVNAAVFERMRAEEFATCADPKLRLVLSSDDAFLVRQPPVWWSDLPLLRTERTVQRAATHRLQQLALRCGRSAFPASVHSTLEEVERGLCIAEGASNCASPRKEGPARRRWRLWTLFRRMFWR